MVIPKEIIEGFPWGTKRKKLLTTSKGVPIIIQGFRLPIRLLVLSDSPPIMGSVSASHDLARKNISPTEARSSPISEAQNGGKKISIGLSSIFNPMHRLPYATKRDALSLLLLLIFTIFHFSCLGRIRISLQADTLIIFFVFAFRSL